MASPFDDIDAAGQAVIEDRTGEAVTIIGMAGGEYSNPVDPERPAQETVAITATSPRVNAVAGGIQGRGATGSNRTHTSNEMLISQARFEALAWRPEKNDKVLIDAGTDAERIYMISAVLPGEFGDVQVILSEEVQPNE